MSERATLRTVDGQPVLRFERRLRHSPETVWRAVSDPAELAHWFPAAVAAEPRVGAPMRFTFPEELGMDVDSDGEVLEYDPPRVYMFRWNHDVLRFEVIPDGTGCRLVFTQSVGGGWVGQLGAGRSATGWDTCLSFLVARLDDRTHQADENLLPSMERYIEEFGLGDGSVRRVDDGYELHFARDLTWRPPAEAWTVLTEGQDLTGDQATQPPAAATIEAAPAGRLRRVDPPHELSYEWRHDHTPAGTVTWRIVADDKLGVRAEVTQTVPATLADQLARLLAGWHVRLELFFAAVHGEQRPWPADRVEALTAHYAATARTAG